jgi:hypothetical protein
LKPEADAFAKRIIAEPRLGPDFGDVRVHREAQPQEPAEGTSDGRAPVGSLTIGAGDDPLEREVDRIAETIIRAPTSATREPLGIGNSSSTERTSRGANDLAGSEPTPGSATPGAPLIVEHVVDTPGRPLAANVRAYFEPRFRHDLSGVRIHDDVTAHASASAIDAAAYTVREHIVFAPGRHAPGTNEGDRLLAHELAHVVRRDASATVRRLSGTRATAPKPTDPTVDEIARELGPALGGPYVDYAAYARTMVAGTFLGHPVGGGARPELFTKLAAAKTAIDSEYAKSGRAIPTGYGISSIVGFRWAEGQHGWGLAVDLDVAGNPYVMHERNEATLDAQLGPVYHRIAEFMLNAPLGGQQSIIPTLITQGGNLPGSAARSRADRIADYYDRLKIESEAMANYFGLMKDPAPTAISLYLAGPWTRNHPGTTPPAAADVKKQMWDDYAVLGGPIPTGGPPGVTGLTAPGAISGADRPFAPHRGAQQDPAAGFLTIPREVVIGLARTLTRWGAIDFGGESGDVQHFDDALGLGAEVSTATRRAAARLAATSSTGTTRP